VTMGAGASSAKRSDQPVDGVDATVEAIKVLQQHLHGLTPYDRSRVKKQLGFATAEWQQGLSLSITPRGENKSVNNRDGSSTVVLDATVPSVTAEVLLRTSLTPDSGKLVLCMVGLPATGKSSIVHKLHQFLGWRGYNTGRFSVGAWRRGEEGAAETLINEDATATDRAANSSASFFDTNKTFASMTRHQITMSAFQSMLKWLHEDGGQIALFDASNVTIDRRAKLQEALRQSAAAYPETSIGMVFIESIVTEPRLIEKEMRWKVRHSNDFRGMTEADALADLHERIRYYEEKYETVREEEGAYIKIFDLKAKVHASNVYGRMVKTVLPYMMAMHAESREIFLCIVEDDADADCDDEALHAALCKWAAGYARAKDLLILTSTMPRAAAAASALATAAGGAAPASRGQLAPVKRSGSSRPSTPAAPMAGCSFMGRFGESVQNLVGRLEPIALEIEASTCPVLVVAHEAPCRSLRALFLNATHKVISEREDVDSSFACDGHVIFEYRPNTDLASFEEVVHKL